MIGNDVVDLGDADARQGATHPRFDERVFAPDERRRIAAVGPGSPLRWMLWAAKEAAYKVAVRRDPACVFAPARFIAELGAKGLGRVRHGDCDHAVRVTRAGACVHAVAAAPGGDLRGVVARVQRAPRGIAWAAASDAVRAFAIADLARRLGVDVDALEIRSRRRIPRLLRRGGGEAAPLSLSHHGRYVAYACLLPAAPGASP